MADDNITGTQIGADGRRHPSELIADVIAPPARHDGWYATFLPMRQRHGDVNLAPIYVEDRAVARLTLTVEDMTGGRNAKSLVTVTGATGGTFTLDVSSRDHVFHVTAPYNVTPSALKTLFDNANTDATDFAFGANNVAVTGSVGNYTIEFVGNAGGRPGYIDAGVDTLTGTSPLLSVDHSSDGLATGAWPVIHVGLFSSPTNEVDEDGYLVNITDTGSESGNTQVSKAELAGGTFTRRIIVSPLDEWVQFSYSFDPVDATARFSLSGEIV